VGYATNLWQWGLDHVNDKFHGILAINAVHFIQDDTLGALITQHGTIL